MADVPRNEHGQWLPGGPSPNPTGRPKQKRITDAYAHILETEGAEKYAQIVANIAATAKKPSEQLAAVQEMTDRTEGRAVQGIRVEPGIDNATAQKLFELAERLLTPEDLKKALNPEGTS